MKFSFLLCLQILLLFTVEARQLVWSPLTTEDGLSDNDVSVILRDKNGFMWFATQTGLNRFDGHKVKIYRHISSNVEGFARSNIRLLYEDPAGHLWVGFDEGGLSRFDPSEERFTDIFLPTNRNITKTQPVTNCILALSANEIGLGTEAGFYVYSHQKKGLTRTHESFRLAGLENDTITCLYRDESANLWVGTLGGLHCLRAGQTRFTNAKNIHNDPTCISQNRITHITSDGQGYLVASYDSTRIVLPPIQLRQYLV